MKCVKTLNKHEIAKVRDSLFPFIAEGIGVGLGVAWGVRAGRRAQRGLGGRASGPPPPLPLLPRWGLGS